MFNSPINKTQAQLVSAARAAASDYIQNGTDLTEAVVKSASALQPITSEHVRRICEMTYHDAYERLFAEKTGMLQYVSFDPPNAVLAAEMLDALQLGLDQQHNFDKLASKTMKRNTRQRLMNKQASVSQTKEASMPRKFTRMNNHELWFKAASGKDLQDHNPTRELQQVHRDLKDSISTVKSELYAAEHNEKLAMIDMVKQAKAGLSAGHSMEQVLHAAVSVVDATEPFMAKTAHDLCATIIEACADHQNSGFRKKAQMFMSPQEAIRRGRENDKAGRSLLGKMMGNHKKEAKAGNILPDPILDRTAQLFTYGGRGFAHGMTQPLEAISNSRGIARAAMEGDPYAINNLGYLPGTALGLSVAPTAGYVGYKKITKGNEKNAAAPQEVNPNHPIPQKFKKLAEANIQRKHLEVTLDELNRNMDYFNEQLKNELTR